MFRALICPSSGIHDYDVDYHIGRVFLGLLYVRGEVQLGWSSVRAAAYKKYNKISSWVFDSSVITMMHDPINIT
jgi:hypothetical protein